VKRMRLMALDIGDRRIGVALSDPSKTLARSLRVVRRRSEEADVLEIASLVEEYEVEKIVVGHPLQLDGTAGEQARRVEAYVEKLREAAGVPIILRDEGLSTVRAREMMIEAGTKQKDRRTRIDAVAAAVILQDYIDSLSTEEKGRVAWEETTR
jgi:putative Holliday junction resolvase